MAEAVAVMMRRAVALFYWVFAVVVLSACSMVQEQQVAINPITGEALTDADGNLVILKNKYTTQAHINKTAMSAQAATAASIAARSSASVSTNCPTYPVEVVQSLSATGQGAYFDCHKAAFDAEKEAAPFIALQRLGETAVQEVRYAATGYDQFTQVGVSQTKANAAHDQAVTDRWRAAAGLLSTGVIVGGAAVIANSISKNSGSRYENVTVNAQNKRGGGTGGGAEGTGAAGGEGLSGDGHQSNTVILGDSNVTAGTMEGAATAGAAEKLTQQPASGSSEAFAGQNQQEINAAPETGNVGGPSNLNDPNDGSNNEAGLIPF